MEGNKDDFARSFKLLCDIFRTLDPSFIDVLKRVTGQDDKEECCKDICQEKQPDWSEDCPDCTEVDIEVDDENCPEYDVDEDPQPHVYDEDPEFDTDSDTGEVSEDVPQTTCNIEEDSCSSYMSKISLQYMSLQYDENKKAVLTVLYVSEMKEFEKYADKWMSDAFEMACYNNLNDGKFYGDIIDYVKFDFYTNAYNLPSFDPERDNVLVHPLWRWDPQMLSFYSDDNINGDAYQYVRFMIQSEPNDDKKCTVMRDESDLTCEGGSIKMDLITNAQREEFICMMNTKLETGKDLVVTKEDIAESNKACQAVATIHSLTACPADTAHHCRGNKRGFIDMDVCKTCPDKDSCRPCLDDYISGMGKCVNKEKSSFMYDDSQFVESISDGEWNVVEYAKNQANAGTNNVVKANIEKDILLDAQKKDISADKFISTVTCAIEQAVKDKHYYYYSDNNHTTVVFNYSEILAYYYFLKPTDNSSNYMYKLGFSCFNVDSERRVNCDDLKDYAYLLADALCDTFEFVHVSILKQKDNENYLIVCDC